ncbi:MAG: bifunctional nuclease domain-containing protein [Gaiellaceae bacterium]
MPQTDDTALVAAARQGDRTAFGLLVERHKTRARAVAHGLLREREEAEDVVQEAILHAYLGLDGLREPDRFGSWLCGIALNLGRMRLRRARGRASVEELSGGTSLPGAATTPPPEAALEELEAVRTALAFLPAGQRQLVFMHYVEGLSCEEIAMLLGRSNGAVRVGLHRARSRLREHLLEKEEMMVEVEVDDVVVRVMKDRPEEGLPELASEMRVVVLREKFADRLLPIWIAEMEGNALALGLRGEVGPRPLTFDLTAKLLELTGGRIERVVVSRLLEKTFYATVTVRTDGRSEELDARPSDAINLAIRVAAPIYVAEEVMESSGVIDRTALETDVDEMIGKRPPSEWRSLSPELVRSLLEAKAPK